MDFLCSTLSSGYCLVLKGERESIDGGLRKAVAKGITRNYLMVLRLIMTLSEGFHRFIYRLASYVRAQIKRFDLSLTRLTLLPPLVFLSLSFPSTISHSATSTLLVTGSADNQMRLWEVSTGTCLYVWEFTTAAKRVQFSSSGEQVLVVTEERMGFKGTVRVFSINRDPTSWTSQSKEPLRTITFSGPKATVAAWAPLDEYIVTGHVNGKVARYYHDEKEPESGIDAELEEKSETYTSTGEAITDLQMSNDRTYFVTSSKDKSSRVSSSSSVIQSPLF